MPDDNEHAKSVRSALHEFLNRLARIVATDLSESTPATDKPTDNLSAEPTILDSPKGDNP
jgi:hypothetical protein